MLVPENVPKKSQVVEQHFAQNLTESFTNSGQAKPNRSAALPNHILFLTNGVPQCQTDLQVLQIPSAYKPTFEGFKDSGSSPLPRGSRTWRCCVNASCI